ncbi:MAG: histidine kinase [Saprospiraceae bacterium]|nr:histidine kinase [Saprospiraceae bacterium]
MSHFIKPHLIFWLLYFLYTWLPLGSMNENYTGFFYEACLMLPITMAATYFIIFITIDRYYLHKRRLAFWVSLIFSLVVFGLLRRFIIFTYVYPVLWPEKCNQPLFYLPKITMEAVHIHLVAGVGAMLFLLSRWREQERLSDILMKEKVAAQLELLKSQVQPHFIFNTLNNIYMLSLKGAPQTSDMIYRLSALLSYMLYDSKEETIGVEKEVDYIKNYINLERIRYGDRLDVQLNVLQNIRDVRVPPLLFLPLVENAFKHGASRAVGESWIHIDISVKGKSLILKVENSLSETKAETNGFGNGLGLDNLRKRLEILYPNNFELKTMKDECSYLAVLKIDLVESKVSEMLNDTLKSAKNQPNTEGVSAPNAAIPFPKTRRWAWNFSFKNVLFGKN